ncbi:MAG: glycosyltransferase [Acidobacteriota bacterium]|nr:glycosyltransferase [Acidobacteriota bacterium]
MLRLAGVELGSSLFLRANSFNEKGYWEREDIVSIHDRMLSSIGVTWDLPTLLADGWHRRPEMAAYKAELLEIAKRDFSSTSLWGMKDPRLCVLLPLWLEVFEELGCEPCFVLTQRDPDAVAQSLRNRDGFPLDRGRLIWLASSLAAERHTRGLRRTLVWYEDLLQDWRVEFRRMAAELDVAWPTTDEEAVDEFLTPGLQHWSGLSDSEQGAPAWLGSLVEDLSSALKSPSPAVLQRLDDVSGDLETAGSLLDILRLRFGPVLGDDAFAAGQAPWEKGESPRSPLLSALARSVSERLFADGVTLRSRVDEVEAEGENLKRHNVRAGVTEGHRHRREATADPTEPGRVESLERELAESRKQNRALSAALRDREDRLDTFGSSLVWRSAARVYGVGNRILPLGSRRRRWIDAFVFGSFEALGRFGARVRRLGASRPDPPPAQPAVLPLGGSSASAEPWSSQGSATSPGSSSRRSQGASPHPVRFPSRRRFRVAYLVGSLEYESARYRVFNVIEALRRVGIHCSYFYDMEIPERIEQLLSADIIVLFRTGWSANVERLVAQARARQIDLVFDVDDLVFEPGALHHVKAIKDWTGSQKRDYEKGVRLYRQALLACPYFTGPCRFLVDQAEALGARGYVLVNSLNQVQLDAAAGLEHRPVKAEEIVLGYFSGTLTHQEDFAVASGAVARILSEFSTVELLVGGHLELGDFPELRPFASRIRETAFVRWQELPRVMAGVDVNLAPLEPDNPFCNAKSELKYFEAALLAIPSVASPTQTYASAIDDGRTGLLATGEDQWFEQVSKLVADSPFRRRMGEAARRSALDRYGPERLGRDARDVYVDILDRRRQGAGVGTDSLVVNFVLPPPILGSGGHKDVFLIANVLTGLGHYVTIHFPDDTRRWSEESLGNFIRAHFCEPEFSIAVGAEVSCCDALIATHYSTVASAVENAHLAMETFYFVQDYEPYFNPMGWEYLKARESYKAGLQCITLGDWLKGVLEDRFGVMASVVPFWVERDIYVPNRSEEQERIVYLARPEMPRRCFELGIQALNEFHDNHPDVEIVLYGSQETALRSVPFPHTDLAVVNKSELGALYRSARLGVAFSTTNPSFVPYEMMACGCPVVDIFIDEELDKLKYGGADNCFLSSPDSLSLAAVFDVAWTDADLRREMADRGLGFANSLPDIEGAGRRFEEILQERVHGSSGTD